MICRRADDVARARAKGEERAREEARRTIVESGPLPIGFDVAVYLNPYVERVLREAWRGGFVAEVARLRAIALRPENLPRGALDRRPIARLARALADA